MKLAIDPIRVVYEETLWWRLANVVNFCFDISWEVERLSITSICVNIRSEVLFKRQVFVTEILGAIASQESSTDQRSLCQLPSL